MELYRQAFRHKSVIAQNQDPALGSNERLEFLGDAVLNAIVTDYLYAKYPDNNEGFLTKLRARIVSRASLNQIANHLKLDQQIEVRQEQQLNTGSIIGNAMEALIGALYLDKGYQQTQSAIVKNILDKHLDLEELANTDHDYKSRILIRSQKERQTAQFVTIHAEELGNEREYTVELRIDGEVVGVGKGPSKKKAEQKAAKQAINQGL